MLARVLGRCGGIGKADLPLVVCDWRRLRNRLHLTRLGCKSSSACVGFVLDKGLLFTCDAKAAVDECGMIFVAAPENLAAAFFPEQVCSAFPLLRHYHPPWKQ